ncbi:hypothetical protein FBU30_005690 [Linnemannia zychae]|nr:hypothetical protein FBU30_005690 [Linnemannia zychae]
MTAKALTRALLVALLGFICLSNLVQGQGTTPGPTGPATSSASGTAPPATGTPTVPTGTVSGTATGTVSGSIIATPTASLPPRKPSDPLSSLTMIEPKANLKNPPLFPLGYDISFSWDYDKYLLLPPSNLTIEAFLPDNTIVTIASAIPGNLKNYTWPAASQKNQTNPIKTAMYTLRIFDGQVGRNGFLPEGGYLITYSGLKFGLYIPGDYVPGSQMHPPVCATCQFSPITNGAMSTMAPWATLVIAFLVSSVHFF